MCRFPLSIPSREVQLEIWLDDIFCVKGRLDAMKTEQEIAFEGRFIVALTINFRLKKNHIIIHPGLYLYCSQQAIFCFVENMICWNEMKFNFKAWLYKRCQSCQIWQPKLLYIIQLDLQNILLSWQNHEIKEWSEKRGNVLNSVVYLLANFMDF